MDDGLEFDNLEERYDFWRGARYAAEEPDGGGLQELLWQVGLDGSNVAHDFPGS